jgi:hypothetical protein
MSRKLDQADEDFSTDTEPVKVYVLYKRLNIKYNFFFAARNSLMTPNMIPHCFRPTKIRDAAKMHVIFVKKIPTNPNA